MTNQDENGNTTTSSTNTKTILALLLYCVSGTLLTLVNKLAIVAFPYANILLVMQNSVAVILLLVGFHFSRYTFGPMPPLNMAIIQLWIPIVILFVVMLISSLLALLYVSVPTLIVMRNLSTLFVAILEYVVLRKTIDGLSIATLIGMLLGAILYAKHDLTFNSQGYTWLCINIVGTSVYQIYIKKVIGMPITKYIGPTGMSFYSNLISLPVLLILVYTMGEFSALSSRFDSMLFLKMKSFGWILLSCILGFSLGTTAFTLNKLISATSMMVANNVNKFSLILLSEICVQSTLDISASIGAVFVLFLGWLYSRTKQHFSKPLFILAIILFVVLNAALEYPHIKVETIRANFNYYFINVNQTNIVRNNSRIIRN